MLKLFAVLFFASCLSLGAAEQAALGQETTDSQAASSHSVQITVREKGSGVPIKRAEGRVGEAVAYADPKGVINFVVPGGEGQLVLSRPGFETERIPFADLRSVKNFDVFLFPATPSDDEIIVRGIRRPETSRKSVTIREAVKVAPDGDPAQIPKILPGVQSSAFSPEIIVRGSGPNDTLYYVDEIKVPFIFHTIGNISVVPDQLLSDVEFSSGGFGAQYGGATGGVVTLRTRSDLIERPKTEFRINLPVYSGIYHERPVGDDAMFAVSARRSYLEFILPPIIKEVSGDSSTIAIPYFGDANIFYFQTLDDGHYKLLTLSSLDGLEVSANLDFADKEDGRGNFSIRQIYHTLSLERKLILNSDWTVTATPSVTAARNRNEIIDNLIAININRFDLRTEFTRRLSRSEKLYLGVEGGYVAAEIEIKAPRNDTGDPFFDFEEAPKVSLKTDVQETDLAAWLAVDQEFGRFTLTPGVRTFYTTQIEKSSADPRLNGRVKLDENNSLKFAVGQYSQPPEYADTGEEFGRDDLAFIRSNHYVLGIETNWGTRWTTDFQGFYKEGYDLVRSVPLLVKANYGSLISYGFEAFIRRNLTERLFGWLAYTYSINQARDRNQETYRNSAFDQTHILNLTGNYRLTATWDLGGVALYRTGDTYTPVSRAVYNANLDKYQPRIDPGVREYSERLPSYHEFNIYANKDFLFDTWQMAMRFGVQFLSFSEQALQVQYNYDYSEQENFTSIPPIPYIEIRGVL